MEAQQIKLNINELMEGIHDEAFLKACYEAVEGIAKAYRRISGKRNGIPRPQTEQTHEVVPLSVFEIKTESLSTDTQSVMGEQILPHDLSLVLLANELFKGSEPLSEEGEMAFEMAFKKSLKTQPTLSNRL